jgi:hypothetical protein
MSNGTDTKSEIGATRETNPAAVGGMGGRVWSGPAALADLLQPLEALTADPANVRTHDARNIDAIATSLRVFGQRFPVVCQAVNGGGLIVRAGNGRLAAARALGWSHLAAVIVAEDDATATAFAIADNRTAELADWNAEALLDALNALGVDAAADAGFDDADVAELLAGIEGDETGADIGADPADGLERFTVRLTREQFDSVRGALDAAARLGPFVDSGNPDDDGNALARVCEMFRG